MAKKQKIELVEFSSRRTLVTTYYGPGRGKDKPIVKVTRGSRLEEVAANISKHMTQNHYGATVASTQDEETGQLLLTATYHIGESLKFYFFADVDRPICLMDV